jgi:mannose-6-phosphate isomerase-like protein (cupin superfamily)
MKKYHKGNIKEDFKNSLGKEGEGWLFGNFLKFGIEDVRKTDKFELKYWDFAEKKLEHKTKVQATAIEFTIVLTGVIEGEINGESIRLKKGEYVLIPPHVVSNLVKKYSKDAEVLTIKSPSDPTDKISIPDCDSLNKK